MAIELSWKIIKQLLPKEIYIEIAGYNYIHRENLRPVLKELLNSIEITHCDNIICELSLPKIFMIHHKIGVNRCYFCCDGCLIRGEDEILHMINKSHVNARTMCKGNNYSNVLPMRNTY